MTKISIYLVKICTIYKKYVDIVHSHQRYCHDKEIVFICTNAPSLLVPPPPCLPLQSSYFGVLHASQQPATLEFQDSEKRYVLVLPKSNTAYEKYRKSQQDKAIMITNAIKSTKIRYKLDNFFKFMAIFQYFKLSRYYMLASEIKAVSVLYCSLPLDSRVEFFIGNSPPF